MHTLMVFLKEIFEEKNYEKEKSADYELPITNYQYIAYVSVTFCVIYMPFLMRFLSTILKEKRYATSTLSCFHENLKRLSLQL